MILWINGAFGVGKTTTANLVTKRLDGAQVFDPEYVGYLLKSFVESPTGDFQDLPLWRHLVVQTVTGLAQHHPRTWVAPMSLINAAYRTEIFDGIRAAGVDLREVILTVAEQRLRDRIDEDQVDTKARRWRQDHVARALTTFAGLTDAHFIDASQPPEQVAEAVAAHVRRQA
ncbi:ATP/GTP-binding protein [Actinoplanes sp. ATCC 53533]|uniref:AAA family ATPase n=1 Tax=Actinoplanes sp. ATCC 53533 TaxID=1288362 RepID=UPI000F77C6E7|nr:AAA family ATPase [Actinoplanes sp. ATCC 53533]RSM52816.1 ATP/GTP-binding protein [Actinoplanes sp. ATCC 53533]